LIDFQTFCAASSFAFSLTGTGPNLALSSTTSFSALSFSYTEYRLNPSPFLPFLASLLLLLLLILLIPPVFSSFSFSSFYFTSPPHIIPPSRHPSSWFSQSSSPPHPSSSCEKK